MKRNWHIMPFDVRNASAAEYRAANELDNRIRAEYLPDDPPIPLDEQTRNWQNIPAFIGVSAWAVWNDDNSKAIASGSVSVTHLETNKHIAEFNIEVLPEFRRQGLARELLARIKAVIRRRMPQLADDVVEIGGLLLDPAARLVRAGDREIDIWTTEFRLLHFFMTHPGRIFSRTRLIDEIWGHDAFVEERTVDVHIRRLRQGLAPTGHDVLIETVRGFGYCFRTDRSGGLS